MKRKSHSKQKNGDYSLAHVLYQKLGNDWYAFTEVDGDCFMTKVNEEEANAARMRSDDEHSTNERAPQSDRKRRAA